MTADACQVLLHVGPPDAVERNRLTLVGTMHAAPRMDGGIVVVRLATPDGPDAHDVHRVECAGRAADVARSLRAGEAVAVEGSLHYHDGPGGAHVRAWRLARVAEHA